MIKTRQFNKINQGPLLPCVGGDRENSDVGVHLTELEQQMPSQDRLFTRTSPLLSGIIFTGPIESSDYGSYDGF